MTVQRYWNQDNFESLLGIARALGDDPRLARIVRYCELREKGVRKAAIAEIEAFLGEAATWEVGSTRDVAVRILETHRTFPGAHQFLTEPLQRRFVEPVLERWLEEDPEGREPLRILFEDWREYRLQPEGSFPEWCAARGREHGFGRTYYFRA